MDVSVYLNARKYDSPKIIVGLLDKATLVPFIVVLDRAHERKEWNERKTIAPPLWMKAL